LEQLIIQQAEYKTLFSGVVQVSDHCSWDVLQNYIRERQNIDVHGLLGSCLFTDLIKDLTGTKYNDLLNGSNYTGCDSNEKTHFGLKRVLTHYAYAAYVYRKSFVDVPFGVVVKQSQDSVPVPTNELRNLHDEHRSIAYEYWKGVEQYLCSAKETLTLWKGECTSCSCDKCSGDCNCSPKSPKSNRTTRIKVIRK